MPKKTYICAACGGTFNTERKDEEADAEALHVFGVPNASCDPEMAVVCTPCYRELLAWMDTVEK